MLVKFRLRLSRFLLGRVNITPHEVKWRKGWPAEKTGAKVKCRRGTRTQGANASPGVVDPEFCKAHGISRGFVLQAEETEPGLNPREMKIGTRTLITFEAAAKWRAEREAASTAPPEKARAKREQAA